eukprot:1944056-Pyramimonas_sp.AAC.1
MSNPMSMMATKRSQWQRAWTDPVDKAADLQASIDTALRRASDDSLPPLSVEEVSSLLSCSAPQRVPGIDVLSVQDIQRLPPSGSQDLTHLFNQIESVGVWPEQLFVALSALLPMPKGGDRTI